MNWDARFQRLLACLGDPSRFRVLEVLADGDRCVTEIAREVGLSQSCTTRHLQTLLREEVVVRTREGKRVLFRIADTDARVTGILEWALLRGVRSRANGGPSSAVASADPGARDELVALRNAGGHPRGVESPGPRGSTEARSRLPVAARRAMRRPAASAPPSQAPPPAEFEVELPAPAAGAAREPDLEDYLL